MAFERSNKALDLLRDLPGGDAQRPENRLNPGGHFKLYGRVRDERQREVREAFHASIKARIDWAPDESCSESPGSCDRSRQPTRRSGA